LQPVREAIRAHGAALSSVVVEARDVPRLEALVRFAQDQGVTVTRAPRQELDRITGGAMHQGVIAWAPPIELADIEAILADERLLAVALDEIQDPQNFGALVRSAVGIAGAALLWGEHASAPLSLATFRASAGAIEHARLCRVRSLTQTLVDAASRAVQVVALDAQADVPLRDLDLTLPTILVIGSEHTGIRKGVRRACTVSAHLVRPGSIDSLNASVAAGIALYECAVQRIRALKAEASSVT
jgi:23S rRNA (guanosine2251-2'-O)-methyltransferase